MPCGCLCAGRPTSWCDDSRVGVVQVTSDQHVQHGIAQKFQPLVARHRRVGPAAVRERLGQQGTVPEVVAQLLLDGHPARRLGLAHGRALVLQRPFAMLLYSQDTMQFTSLAPQTSNTIVH
jgi:hypothetical protein